MASRKEQKEQLRKEREEREAAAKAAAQRKRLVGYGAGGALVLAVVVILVLVLAGGGDDGGDGVGSAVLPDGGSVPAAKETDLDAAVKAAGCELKNFKGTSREHTDDLAEPIEYASSPPTSGKHYVVPAEDGAYDEAPDVKQLVHTLEHGRVIIWFKRNLPKDDRANLAALFEEDELPDGDHAGPDEDEVCRSRPPPGTPSRSPTAPGGCWAARGWTRACSMPSGCSRMSIGRTGPSRFRRTQASGLRHQGLQSLALQGFSQDRILRSASLFRAW